MVMAVVEFVLAVVAARVRTRPRDWIPFARSPALCRRNKTQSSLLAKTLSSIPNRISNCIVRLLVLFYRSMFQLHVLNCKGRHPINSLHTNHTHNIPNPNWFLKPPSHFGVRELFFPTPVEPLAPGVSTAPCLRSPTVSQTPASACQSTSRKQQKATKRKEASTTKTLSALFCLTTLPSLM
jgi:hypothetical protein